MKRKIIEINEEKCIGCGACANACNEGAIKMINGKAKLVRDDYCDGLGNCLPVCPTDAISFVEREALPFDEKAVKKNEAKTKEKPKPLACGCSGTHEKSFNHSNENDKAVGSFVQSRLNQWPVQIKLVNENASYFENADLLVAADCCAYAYGNFHNDFIKNKITIIGCPKLDDVDYTEKIFAILNNNNIKSVTVVRMEVPCCGGIEAAVKNALQQSGKFIPWQVVTLSTDGKIKE